MYPTFRYHPTLAPEGKKFTNQADYDALGPEWVDTPAKFPLDPVPADDAPVVDRPVGGRRARKETV